MSRSIAAAATPPGRPPTPLVARHLVRWHLIAAMTWLAVALAAGMLYSLQLLQHWPLPRFEPLSPGRIRMIHTNLIGFGFLANAFLATLCWSVPRLTGHRLVSHTLGWAILTTWNLAVLAACVGLHLGAAQGIEWGETPGWIDRLIAVLVVAVGIRLSTPILRGRAEGIYVSLWYFAAGLVWLAMTSIGEGSLPQPFVAASGGELPGLFVYNPIGLWVTPMGLGMMYFFVPVILGRAIWSHSLALAGFWALAIFCPLLGVHQSLGSPIRALAPYSSMISTLAIELVVATAIVNFFMTWRASDKLRAWSLPSLWFWIGTSYYAIACLQLAVQISRTLREITPFTDWGVGHAHLVLFGVFGFWTFGMIEHLWPRLTGGEWRFAALRRWSLWLMTLGLGAMFLTLTASGLIDGFLSKGLLPRETILETMYPFWLGRTLLGLVVAAGFACLALNMALTARMGRSGSRTLNSGRFDDREVPVGAH